MMRPSHDLANVFLCLDPVDFRKGINGLATLVETLLVGMKTMRCHTEVHF